MHRQRSLIDLAIEGVWLIAVALVPLAFSGRDVVVLFLQPKDFILHAAALSILALWGFDWALGGYQSQLDPGSWTSIRRWLDRSPRNWALTASAGFGVAVVFSTILSPLPAVSLWGRDFSQLGYELYSVLSFLVIFFAIALRVHSAQQVRRIFWAIAGAGVLTGVYGISQHFGWDPIGYGAGQARVISSFANPIYFGSYLLMSVAITLGLALDGARRNDKWLVILFAALIGIQLAALWFTGSRGPWIGTFIALVTFFVLGVLALDRSQLMRGGTALVTGLLIAAVLVNLPADTGRADSSGLESIVSGLTRSAAGLSGRTDIWQASAHLLDSWETQVSETAVSSALRPIFGLGPEMYYYSYPLVANAQKGISVPANAHNSPLQIVLELGAVGLIAFAALAISVFAAGVAYIRNRSRNGTGPDTWLTVVMVTVIAALLGRAAEQMVGLARVGDLVPFWALLAVVLAVYGIGHSGRSVDRDRVRPRPGRSPYLPIGAAVIVTALALALFVSRDLQMLRSGLTAADALEKAVAGDTATAINLLNRASDRSPDIQQYHVWAGELLIKEAQGTADAGVAVSLLRDARETIAEYESRDALSFLVQIRLGLAELELVNRGDISIQNDLIGRSVNTADAMPAYPDIQAAAAERVLVAGQLELGLQLAERAIAMESDTSPQTLAWFMRGKALGDLGDVQGALESFQASLDRESNSSLASDVHRSMALAYESIGKPSLAAEHIALAEEIRASLTGEDN